MADLLLGFFQSMKPGSEGQLEIVVGVLTNLPSVDRNAVVMHEVRKASVKAPADILVWDLVPPFDDPLADARYG